jgi:hypothetical protein
MIAYYRDFDFDSIRITNLTVYEIKSKAYFKPALTSKLL